MPTPAESNAQALAERRALAAKLAAEGLTLNQIAARLDVTPRTVSRYKVKLGITAPPHRPWTDMEHRRAQELLDDGYSLMEVARTLDRSPWVIGRRFKGQGWTPSETGQFNALRRWEMRVLGV